MRRLLHSVGSLALVTLAFGCAAPVDEPSAGEEVGTAASPQLDAGQRTYTIAQSGSLAASAWAGTLSTGADAEYWVTLPGYSSTATRTFTSASQSCSDWKRTVCTSPSYAGASFYRAVVAETTLDCALPPGPCSPAPGAVSLLGSGTYEVDDARGSPYAWTYVSGACEYWAMDHTIASGTSTQGRLTFGWASLGGFEAGMCAKSPVPSTFYTVYYEPVANFCSTSTC